MTAFPITYPGVISFTVLCFDALSQIDVSTITAAGALRARSPEGVTKPGGGRLQTLTIVDSAVIDGGKGIALKLEMDITSYTPAQDGTWEVLASKDIADEASPANTLFEDLVVGTFILDLAAGESNDEQPPTVTLDNTTQTNISSPGQKSVNYNFGALSSLPQSWEAGTLANPVFSNFGVSIGDVQPDGGATGDAYIASPSFPLTDGTEIIIEYEALPQTFNTTGTRVSGGYVGLNFVTNQSANAIAWLSTSRVDNGITNVGDALGNEVEGDNVQMKILISGGYALCTFSKEVGGSFEVQQQSTYKLLDSAIASSRVVCAAQRVPMIISRIAY